MLGVPTYPRVQPRPAMLIPSVSKTDATNGFGTDDGEGVVQTRSHSTSIAQRNCMGAFVISARLGTSGASAGPEVLQAVGGSNCGEAVPVTTYSVRVSLSPWKKSVACP